MKPDDLLTALLTLLLALGAHAPAAIATPASTTTAPDPGLVSVLAGFDADEHRDLQGVVVMREGRVVAERYFNAASADTLTDVRSAGKSITALLLGIAIDRGFIHNVDDPVSTYWKDAAGTAIGDVRVRDVLTMRSGLAAFDDDPDSPGNEDRMDAATDPLAFV